MALTFRTLRVAHVSSGRHETPNRVAFMHQASNMNSKLTLQGSNKLLLLEMLPGWLIHGSMSYNSKSNTGLQRQM